MVEFVQCHAGLPRRFISAAMKKPRATTKRTATPYSCWTSKKASTKAMITSTDVTIALAVENNMALFKSTARRTSRGMSAFSFALAPSPSLMAFNACDLLMTRFIRLSSTEMNDATAANKNVGAVI
jgi:hypothetical protein